MSGTGGFKTVAVGDIEVIALSDGGIDLPLALFPSEAADDASIGPGPFPTAINCFVIRTSLKTYLVDAGCGPWRGAATGHLSESLRQAGLSPSDIDVVLMTHLHGDHVGGLRTEAGAAFPRAELWVAGDEIAFWQDPELPGRSPERMQATIQAARAGLQAYEGRTVRFRAGDKVAPGITTVALPGHTPGHTGFMVESGGERLLIWADIVHVAGIQFAHPDWPIGFDVDGAAAVASRQKAMAEAADDDLWIAGMHLPFPALGRVRRSGSAYAWAPEA